MNKMDQKIIQKVNKPKESYSLNPMDEIFKGDPLEKAIELQEKETKNIQTNDNKQKKLENRNKKHLERKIKRTTQKKNKKKSM